MMYAGVFRRFVAFCVDVVVMIGIYMACGLVFGVALIGAPFGALPMVGFWFYGGMFFLSWVYVAFFESSKWQGTIGKQLLNIKVTDLYGERISFWRASARYFSKYLSRALFMLGFLLILLTEKRQALHDKITRTLLITT